jgi:hypothetical protein
MSPNRMTNWLNADFQFCIGIVHFLADRNPGYGLDLELKYHGSWEAFDKYHRFGASVICRMEAPETTHL